jgi:hypothetical protein
LLSPVYKVNEAVLISKRFTILDMIYAVNF